MSSLANPQVGTVIPSDANKKQIGSLITHIARSDNHLWQALTSLQSQANAIISLTTDWTSWDATVKDNLGVPLDTVELGSYYMVSGQICFIEVSGNVVLSSTSVITSINIDLPVNLGETVSKTCAAYLAAFNTDGSLNLAMGDGVVLVNLWKQIATVFIRPTFTGLTCRFTMGGAIGIIQTPGLVTGVNTPPR